MTAPTINGRPAIWVAQKGGQEAFLSCPVFEVLAEGNRGGGKTDVLLMDFFQHVGAGYGSEWRGILFRKTYKQLKDVVAKSRKWFSQFVPEARFNKSAMEWEFPGGEALLLSYMDTESDYENYHGHAYPWIGWEELTTWASPNIYKRMMSCCRSPVADIPRCYRATTNPYGPGHNWVKQRFKLPVPPYRINGDVVVDEDPDVPDRVAIRISLADNRVLTRADPTYLGKIKAAARNESERKAWVEGSWDIVAGGMFDDIWAPPIHVLPNFPTERIPANWRIDRAYDHGQSAPFSVGWYAESNGEAIEWEGRKIGTRPGDLVRFAEWYGWNGTANEGLRMASADIARGIVERERQMGLLGRVHPGPADTSIFDDFEPGKSVAGEMRKVGVGWERADKARKQGWERMRTMIRNAVPGFEGDREGPGLFVCARCTEFLRTVPVLPRSDKDIDDADTESEDHVGDEVRYRCRRRERGSSKRSF